MTGKAESIVRATGTVTYGDLAAAAGLTLTVYDQAGAERFRSPARVEGTAGSRALVADRPCPEGFTAYSYAVIVDATGDVVATGGLPRVIDVGETIGLPMPSISSS
jgi:hypothetical protein